MRALVTGGAGFIGSHLCEALSKAGFQVMALDNLETGSLANIQNSSTNIDFIEGDLRDSNLIDSLVSANDLVFHLAASVGVQNILADPLKCVENNIIGSRNVLTSAAKYSKRILIASTSEIYGKNPIQPLSETDDRVIGSPQKTRWIYSDSKAIEESIAQHLFLDKGLPVTVIRLFNTVGPRQSGTYGMVIPRFIKSALGNKDLEIYGDGLQTRVFCHVNDAVNAFLKIADSSKTIGQVYNVGGIEETSILNLAKIIVELTNSQSRIILVPYELAYESGFEEIQRRVPNISKINNDIDWAPSHSLKDIIIDCI